MIRRPITSIELRLEDLQEYTTKKELGNASNITAEEANQMFKWNASAKSSKEIHDRIGLTQQNKRNNPTT